MQIQQITLSQFRNYTSLQLDFSPDINCFVGPNGAGKTNILDALHYLAFTRGFRSLRDKHAIQRGTDFFVNQARVQEENRLLDIQCNVLKSKGKKVLINGKALSKLSSHIGRIPLVAILPHDTELIHGPAADRRRFIDMLIAQYDAAYLKHLIAYDQLLLRRNALLKHFGQYGNYDLEQIQLYDSQIIPHAIAIREGRSAFLKSFHPIFEHFFEQIVQESQEEQPKIRYRSAVEENTPAAWLALFERQAEKDRVNEFSTAGIHREELVFSINGQSVRNFGSQGQQKTFVIALKLAQNKLLKQIKKQPPILLLDDIFDKLDEHRLTQIAQIMGDEQMGQIFITDTSVERLQKVFKKEQKREVRFFKVEAGQVALAS